MASKERGYPDYLKYFIWKWQVYFVIGQKVTAEMLFKEIDKRLSPEVFMLGFSTVDSDKPPIYYEPEDIDVLGLDRAAIVALAGQLDAIDPERSMFYTGDGMQEEMNGRRLNKNLQRAIEKTLDNDERLPDRVHFVSTAVFRNDYQVYIVLSLRKSIYVSHVHLTKVDPEDRMLKHLSVIEAATANFLADCAYHLQVPDAGKGLSGGTNHAELLRKSAYALMQTIGFTGRNGGQHNLPKACDVVSITPYEKKEAKGHLIIARQGHPDIEMFLHVKEPYRITEHRKLRKELQVTDDELGVVTDANHVFGLGRKKPSYDPAKEEIFDILFLGTACYDVIHHDRVLLRMRYREVHYPDELIRKKGFYDDAKRLFGNIADDQIGNLYDLATHACNQKNGALIIFSSDAEVEANRLRYQCICTEALLLQADLMAKLCSTDGALLIDLEGRLHAKGVILDGTAGKGGDASRGSRYNAALTYYSSREWEKPTLIVVVSEDGMVDVIPTLRPRIKHSEIIQLIQVLESLDSDEEFSSQAFYDTMGLLTNRQFYLTAKECETINQLKEKLQERDQHNGGTVWWRFESFTPDPEMSERYYADESNIKK